MSRAIDPRRCFTDMIDPLRYAKGAFKAAGDDDLAERMDFIQTELADIGRQYELRAHQRMREARAKRMAEVT